MTISMTVEHSDGQARTGQITTPRGAIATPVFMPVGTRAAVKTLDTADIERLDPPIILGNTYHLMERPGSKLIADLGGLHAFMDWNGHILTDSGGFQVFSLQPKVSEEAARFKSVYDGRYIDLSPEWAVEIQQDLGSDIAMVLDVCSALPAEKADLRRDMELSLRWAQRCKDAHSLDRQALFGICQGGVETDLREESAKRTVELGFDGYAIGGLSVGESRNQMVPALQAAIAHLPVDKPRYFMGLGDPLGLITAVENGVDMFDCVLPTRLARHGTALTWQGRLNLKNKVFATDSGPIDPDFVHDLSGRYSRAYIRHLLVTKEPTAGKIITLHNLAWLADLVTQMREAIKKGELAALKAKVAAVYS